jgi:DNA replicative helicase MCM subunit Mcm2 (Cdc46/Mcm family)
VAADLENGTGMQLPSACPGTDARGQGCKGTNFGAVEGEVVHGDYQELRLVERTQCLALGAVPVSITTVMLDDLADSCQAGGAPPPPSRARCG